MTATKATDPSEVIASAPGPCRWTAADLAWLPGGDNHEIPPFALDRTACVAGFDLWDMWPVEHVDGRLPRFDGAALWMVLTAPAGADPDDRHAIARIHLLTEKEGVWTLHRPVFPDGFTPGNREWSGSAVLDDAGDCMTVYFTAAGQRGVPGLSLEQRLFEAQCSFTYDRGVFHLSDWTSPVESLVADGTTYMIANQTEGRAGDILGFRDPGYFRDPETGRHFLFFTGSCARSSSRWTGVIGVAEANTGCKGDWRLLAPVVNAEGLNNEMERPHMRHVGGSYYLFWSTQQKVFATNGLAGPTGLYGAAAPTPLGPFTLLNGSGLVAGVPREAPGQEYSWWVLNDLQVIGFADYPGVPDMAQITNANERRAHFAGYPAPFFRIALEGTKARVLR